MIYPISSFTSSINVSTPKKKTNSCASFGGFFGFLRPSSSNSARVNSSLADSAKNNKILNAQKDVYEKARSRFESGSDDVEKILDDYDDGIVKSYGDFL